MKKTSTLLTCAVVSLLAAVILFGLTAFGFIPFRGAATVTDATQLSAWDYVTTDVNFIMDFCAVEADAETGETVAYYAVAPIGNRFVMLRFAADSFDDAEALRAATMNYLGGASSSMSVHLPTTGTARQADQTLYAHLSDWFAENNEWMSEAGVIGEVTSSADYLSAYYIDVDHMGLFGLVGSVVVCVAAMLLVVLALVLLGALVFGRAPSAKTAKPAKKPTPAPVVEPLNTLAAPELSVEPEPAPAAEPEVEPESEPEPVSDAEPEAAAVEENTEPEAND